MTTPFFLMSLHPPSATMSHPGLTLGGLSLLAAKWLAELRAAWPSHAEAAWRRCESVRVDLAAPGVGHPFRIKDIQRAG